MPLALLFAIAATGGDVSGCLKGIDHRGFVRSQMLECATRDMDRADAALNEIYARALARLSGPARERLRRDERRWIASRHRLCGRAQAPIPSPEINRLRCLARETDRRTAMLRAMR